MPAAFTYFTSGPGTLLALFPIANTDGASEYALASLSAVRFVALVVNNRDASRVSATHRTNGNRRAFFLHWGSLSFLTPIFKTLAGDLFQLFEATLLVQFIGASVEFVNVAKKSF